MVMEDRILEDHILMHKIFNYSKEDTHVDIDRYRYNLIDDGTRHSDLCLRHCLDNESLWFLLKKDSGDHGICRCRDVMATTKSNGDYAMWDIPSHTHPLRRRRLELFNVPYKNYLKIQRL
jgi:hypothetical protein